MGSYLQKPDNTYTDIETVSMSNSFRRVHHGLRHIQSGIKEINFTISKTHKEISDNRQLLTRLIEQRDNRYIPLRQSSDNDTSYDSEDYLKPICHEYTPMTGGRIRSSHMYENALDAGYNQSMPMINEIDEHNTL